MEETHWTLALHKKWSFALRIFLVNRELDLLEKSLMENFIFLCSEACLPNQFWDFPIMS